MLDYQKALEKIRELPWRTVFGVFAASFLLASVVSSVFIYLLIPSSPQLPTKTESRAGGGNGLPSGSITITNIDIKKICDRNLFNKEEKCPGLDEVKEPSETNANDLVKSDLSVKVVGIIYGGTPFNGLATILNTQKNKINSFIVGDLLMKDAEVAEIWRTRVILLRSGGRREYLELEQKEILRSKRRKKKSSSQNPLNRVAPIAKGPAPKDFSEEGFERKGSDMIMTEAYKNQILSPANFTKVLQDAKATPNVVDGQIKGFRLTRIREGSVYQKAGFQNDDVVEEINGEPLTNAAAAIRLLQSLRNEAEIEVLVNRSGSTFPMSLRVQ